MKISARTIVLFALASATTACMSRVRPTTYFVQVNEWDALAGCILVTSIERGYSTRTSPLGIHVTRPVNGSRATPSDLNRSPYGGPNPLRVMKPSAADGPLVSEEVRFARTIIPEGIVLKAEALALELVNPVTRARAAPSKVAPSALIQGVKQVLERACMRNVPRYTGTATTQIAAGGAGAPGVVATKPDGQ